MNNPKETADKCNCKNNVYYSERINIILDVKRKIINQDLNSSLNVQLIKG